MQFYSKTLNRTIRLDDKIVSKYCETDALSEDIFVIAMIGHYGHKPTIKEASDKELSAICNNAMLTELKALTLLLDALSLIQQVKDNYIEVSDAGIPMSFLLKI